MDTNLGLILLLLAITIASYYYAKQKSEEEIGGITKKPKQQPVIKKEQENYLKEELGRRAKILEKVEVFIKGSKFIEPIATWKEDKIYKYIFNNGKLYEFDDIMPESNQRIGIDEEYLCFKRFCYKRVNNPINFLNKFGYLLGNKNVITNEKDPQIIKTM